MYTAPENYALSLHKGVYYTHRKGGEIRSGFADGTLLKDTDDRDLPTDIPNLSLVTLEHRCIRTSPRFSWMSGAYKPTADT